MTINQMSCCGTKELTGLGTHPSPEAAIRSLSGCGQNWAHLIFTCARWRGVNARNYGQELADYIADNKLGTVTASVVKVNPNSGNRLQVFVWTPNKSALTRWFKSH